MIDNRLYPALEDGMDWAVKRHQAISANITNASTPGYRAQDVSFSQELQLLQLNATNGKHIPSAASAPRMQRFEVHSTVKEGENSVDLDREMTELDKNALHYVSIVQFVSQKLKTLRYAISEGGKS